MIILDTNVISELVKPRPHASVLAWLDARADDEIWTTTVTIFEVRFGLAAQPDGRRRRELTTAFEQVLRVDFAGRVLDRDVPAATEAGRIAGAVRLLGKPMEIRDVLIAGTVAARRATLATRNTRHFADAGIPLVDPWAA